MAVDPEILKAMDDLNDAIQHVVQMIGVKNGVPATVAANWVLGFDRRMYTGEGGYIGTNISWLPRLEQPRYISEAIAGQVYDYLANPAQYMVPVSHEEDD